MNAPIMQRRCAATFFFLINTNPAPRRTALSPLRVAFTAGRSFMVMPRFLLRSRPGKCFGGGQGLRCAFVGFAVEIPPDAALLVEDDEFLAVDKKVAGVARL